MAQSARYGSSNVVFPGSADVHLVIRSRSDDGARSAGFSADLTSALS